MKTFTVTVREYLEIRRALGYKLSSSFPKKLHYK